MRNTVRYFRDALTIDQTLISSLNASFGDTLVLGARQLALLSLSPAFNYVIAADQMTVVPGALISIPAGLAALQRISGMREDITLLLGELNNAAKDPYDWQTTKTMVCPLPPRRFNPCSSTFIGG